MQFISKMLCKLTLLGQLIIKPKEQQHLQRINEFHFTKIKF